MDFFKKLTNSEGGYIFLSHSHDDIIKVRKIRNTLEANGFEPLCFYLKCLSDDNEIEDLIKREIDAREWFVFVNSANSRKSKWVTIEREYIMTTDNKKIITVDIDNEDDVQNALYKILHGLRVFISYSNKDYLLASKIRDALVKKDYLVYFGADSMSVGESFISQITSAITEASRDGCVIAIITENSVKSNFVMSELLVADNKGGNIIPIIVGNPKIDKGLSLLFDGMKCYRLPEMPSDLEIDNIIEEIGKSII